MTSIPPTHRGSLERREARLAYLMLVPTFVIVIGIVLGPLMANFWISAKPVTLGDLRSARVMVNESIRPRPQAAGEAVVVRYRVRNSSQTEGITGATLTDTLPDGLTIGTAPAGCTVNGQTVHCDFGTLAAKQRVDVLIPVTVQQLYLDNGIRPRDGKATTTGRSQNVLTSLSFTTENFRKVFNGAEFWTVLKVSLYYTIGGTAGALVLGLFAAQLLNTAFKGRNLLRGLFLFPYVAPVIAVAFAWVLLLDAGPGGTFNAMLMQMGATEGPINFLGQRAVDFEILGYDVSIPFGPDNRYRV